jgi:hypothetical protein
MCWYLRYLRYLRTIDPDLLLVFGRELISNCKPVDGRICDLFVAVVAKIEPYVLRSNYLVPGGQVEQVGGAALLHGRCH